MLVGCLVCAASVPCKRTYSGGGRRVEWMIYGCGAMEADLACAAAGRGTATFFRSMGLWDVVEKCVYQTQIGGGFISCSKKAIGGSRRRDANALSTIQRGWAKSISLRIIRATKGLEYVLKMGIIKTPSCSNHMEADKSAFLDMDNTFKTHVKLKNSVIVEAKGACKKPKGSNALCGGSSETPNRSSRDKKNMFGVIWFVRLDSKHKNVREIEGEIKQLIDLWKQRSVPKTDSSAPLEVIPQHCNCLLLLNCLDKPVNLDKLHDLDADHSEYSCHFQTIITTRSQNDFEVMHVDLEIRMEDYVMQWDIFSENVGELLFPLKSIALNLIEECQGHFLAIVLLARALRGVTDIGVWKHALRELTTLPPSPVEGISQAVVSVLRFIWLRMDIVSQYCVLYCTSHSNGTVFEKALLISTWIENGLIETREHGEEILHSLVGSFLLESTGAYSVRMHEEIRFLLLTQIIHHVHKPFGKQRGSELQDDLSSIQLVTLDLSNTSMKSFPASIASLGCALLMELPHEIGALKNLKVFDFEGTEVICFPKEIAKLSKLECLKGSLHAYADPLPRK
ncbi:hypothetical protein RJ639_037407 [Escallonia herrerae]|uniref:Uncharacterized protein n=1 Tax=Escallonia herrerae TaxID=1293975 RepID=A0AA89B6E5_9ASTE|nr:hypothetical protein RJ639_037407 [Escallonia herrerae]